MLASAALAKVSAKNWRAISTMLHDDDDDDEDDWHLKVVAESAQQIRANDGGGEFALLEPAAFRPMGAMSARHHAINHEM